MTAVAERFLLDANAFIQAKRRFYGLDFCPGYWRLLVWHQQSGVLGSIDKVRDELEAGADDLGTWAHAEFGAEAFASTNDAAVTAAFGEMLAWVMAQPQFTEAAKNDYLASADGWLAAYARTTGAVVVTLEEFDPVVKRRVPLPNVCRAFDVPFITPFDMLRRLRIELAWSPPA